ncbi:hypothetical protein F2Q68_00030438 [Brassica cretica]|uniref:Uncharacterized protein n=1 Tax=Brassica cretica TaxID=69181 RepID=A0A8S9GEM4_BRACR|nr:hypothetical protein F2Q68_00030438 [Brassica cretica]
MFPQLLPPSPTPPTSSPRLHFGSNSLKVSSFDPMFTDLLETSPVTTSNPASVYIGSKDNTFSELEPFDRGGVGGAGYGGNNGGNMVLSIIVLSTLFFAAHNSFNTKEASSPLNGIPHFEAEEQCRPQQLLNPFATIFKAIDGKSVMSFLQEVSGDVSETSCGAGLGIPFTWNVS